MNSRTTFAVTITLLVALTLGGGIAGFRLGTAEPATQGGVAEGGPQTLQTPNNTGPDTGSSTNNANVVPGSAKPGDNEANTGAASTSGNSAAAGTSSAVGSGSAAAGNSTPAAGQGVASANGASGASTGGAQSGTTTTNLSTAGTSSGSGAPVVAGSGVSGNSTAADIQANGVNNRGAAGTEGVSGGTPSGTRPGVTPTNTTVNDAAAAPDAAAGGEKFASAGCSGCHGADAHGGVGPNLTLADGPKGWTLDQFTAVIREGRAPDRNLSAVMPKFSPEQLSDQDIANIQAHIKTLP